MHSSSKSLPVTVLFVCLAAVEHRHRFKPFLMNMSSANSYGIFPRITEGQKLRAGGNIWCLDIILIFLLVPFKELFPPYCTGSLDELILSKRNDRLTCLSLVFHNKGIIS